MPKDHCKKGKTVEVIDPRKEKKQKKTNLLETIMICLIAIGRSLQKKELKHREMQQRLRNLIAQNRD